MFCRESLPNGGGVTDRLRVVTMDGGHRESAVEMSDVSPVVPSAGPTTSLGGRLFLFIS